jgi:hypothetical protein
MSQTIRETVTVTVIGSPFLSTSAGGKVGSRKPLTVTTCSGEFAILTPSIFGSVT